MGWISTIKKEDGRPSDREEPPVSRSTEEVRGEVKQQEEGRPSDRKKPVVSRSIESVRAEVREYEETFAELVLREKKTFMKKKNVRKIGSQLENEIERNKAEGEFIIEEDKKE